MTIAKQSLNPKAIKNKSPKTKAEQKKSDKKEKQYKDDTSVYVKTTERQPLPKRKNGALFFPDFPAFRPNLTPKQVLQMGSFGGTYFRPISSSVTGKKYRNVHNEFPSNWFKGLDIKKNITSEKCTPELNKYKVRAGSSLLAWEQSGWIKPQDPYGWFQWYCRFFMGRRTNDDQRQVDRWDNYAGLKRGRWRRNLVGKIIKESKAYNDPSVSPVIRQGLLHWGFELKKKDFELSKAQRNK